MVDVKNIFIMMVMFVAVIGGTSAVILQMSQDYNEVPDSKFFNPTISDGISFSDGGSNGTKLNSLYNLSQTVTEDINQDKLEQSTLDVIFSGGFTAIKQVLSSFEIVKSMIYFIAITLEIPPFIITAILSVILFTIVILIIFAILGRR